MRKSTKGVTLLEVMLVLAIAGVIMSIVINFMTQRTSQLLREKTAAQMQTILNGALAYYNNYGKWPTVDTTNKQWVDLSVMQSTGYLGAGTLTDASCTACSTSQKQIANVFGLTDQNGYSFAQYSSHNISSWWNDAFPSQGNFYVVGTTTPKLADAQIIAGMLPNGATHKYTKDGIDRYLVWTAVPIPGQNLNNARSVNFTSIYTNGGCAPVPTCPGNMQPSIVASAVSVNGAFEEPTGCTNSSDPSTCSFNLYPVTSFNTYVMGGSCGSANPLPNCYDTATSVCPVTTTPAPAANQKYWRVCLLVTVEAPGATGHIVPSGPNKIAWEMTLGTISVMTRCVPATENTTCSSGSVTEFYGSPLNVWGP